MLNFECKKGEITAGQGVQKGILQRKISKPIRLQKNNLKDIPKERRNDNKKGLWSYNKLQTKYGLK